MRKMCFKYSLCKIKGMKLELCMNLIIIKMFILFYGSALNPWAFGVPARPPLHESKAGLEH